MKKLTLGEYERITDTHIYFLKGPLSQWPTSRFKPEAFVTMDSKEIDFVNAEQYMMYNKAILFNDQETADKILSTSSPKDIKDLGRQVKNYVESEWARIRLGVVTYGNIMKFSQNENLKQFLKSTGDKILVEAAGYDRIWGVGLYQDDDLILDEKNWKGQNLLGKALMNVREALNRKDAE